MSTDRLQIVPDFLKAEAGGSYSIGYGTSASIDLSNPSPAGFASAVPVNQDDEW